MTQTYEVTNYSRTPADAPGQQSVKYTDVKNAWDTFTRWVTQNQSERVEVICNGVVIARWDVQGIGVPNRKAERRARAARLLDVPRAGDLAWAQGYDDKSNPHSPGCPAHMRWYADWWDANARAYDDHVFGLAEAQEDAGHG